MVSHVVLMKPRDGLAPGNVGCAERRQPLGERRIVWPRRATRIEHLVPEAAGVIGQPRTRGAVRDHDPPRAVAVPNPV